VTRTGTPSEPAAPAAGRRPAPWPVACRGVSPLRLAGGPGLAAAVLGAAVLGTVLAGLARAGVPPTGGAGGTDSRPPAVEPPLPEGLAAAEGKGKEAG